MFKKLFNKIIRKNPVIVKDPIEVSMEKFNRMKLAVLIDSDNISHKKVPYLLTRIDEFGHVSVCKAYGNWFKENNKSSWVELSHKYGIQTINHIDYVTGKNTTDLAMVMDIMDMLHREDYDGFVIVSSDSDFTSLANRLREAGKWVMGAGRDTTHEAFANSCDLFITLPRNHELSGEPLKEEVTDEEIQPNYEIIEKGIKSAFAEFGSDTMSIERFGDIFTNKGNIKCKEHGFASMRDMLNSFSHLVKLTPAHRSRGHKSYYITLIDYK
jgi:uncharacterized protein (TIGR00288 family)